MVRWLLYTWWPLYTGGHKGKPVNRRGDFGHEILCEYIFEGDDLSCEWLHRKDRREIWCQELPCCIKQQPKLVIQCKTVTVNFISTVLPVNYDEFKVKNSVERLCCYSQGYCLTGTRAPGAPKLWVRATKVFFKEPKWAPKHGVFVPIQSVGWPQSSQEIDQKFIHTIN